MTFHGHDVSKHETEQDSWNIEKSMTLPSSSNHYSGQDFITGSYSRRFVPQFSGMLNHCWNSPEKIFHLSVQRNVHRPELWLKSRKENPQKLTQLSSHPRHLVGKRTAQKDITIDTTSDSQVNSNFPNRWSPASLTFNNYFYLFLYLYITWITTNNNAPHLKSPKNQSRRAALGRPAMKITGGLELVCGRPTLALSSALVHQTLQLQRKYHTTKQDQIIQKH